MYDHGGHWKPVINRMIAVVQLDAQVEADITAYQFYDQLVKGDVALGDQSFRYFLYRCG